MEPNNWKAGPLPPDSYQWGGVVPVGENVTAGFYYADFHGDHVVLCPSGRVVKAGDIALYNNSLTLPPGAAMGSTSRKD